MGSGSRVLSCQGWVAEPFQLVLTQRKSLLDLVTTYQPRERNLGPSYHCTPSRVIPHSAVSVLLCNSCVNLSLGGLAQLPPQRIHGLAKAPKHPSLPAPCPCGHPSLPDLCLCGHPSVARDNTSSMSKTDLIPGNIEGCAPPYLQGRFQT